MSTIQWLRSAFICLPLVSCDHNHGIDNLLSVPVIDTEAVSGEILQDYQQLLQNHSHQQAISPSSLQVFGERYVNANASIYSINKKSKGDVIHYSVTLIFDRVPNDELVNSYRYDMQLKLKDSMLVISKMEQSWRCKQGKESQAFSIETCD